jgi:hypothetical protein
MHTQEGDNDDSARCSAKELIDLAYQQGFDVLSITNHDAVTYNKYLVDYAAERGILLIEGVEATIERKHVLLYNFDFSGHHINTFADIKRLKKDDNLCLAPHPFYPSATSLQRKFDRNLDIFDGLEFCHFYSKQINFNKKAVDRARKYNLPLVGMSDAHIASQLGASYSLVEAEKDIESVIRAIKKGKIEIVSHPLGTFQLGEIILRLLIYEVLGFLTNGRGKIKND